MRQYPSKLLLFGEYILLLGARALAVPVPAFHGKWAAREAGNRVDSGLQKFAQSPELAAVPGLDRHRFQQDIEAGWYFKSNIPQGYGLGSSGALCAAVYDRYVDPQSTDWPELKRILAGMESYFHGQSSGIDPLTSYLNRAIWVSNQAEIQLFEAPIWAGARPVIFLLDTGLPRQTGPLVQWFLEKSRQAEYRQRLEADLLAAHARVLDAWASGHPEPFWEALARVSAFQLEWMQPMIPGHLQAPWANALFEKKVLLKICGAGGGGYLLGFAPTKAAAVEQFGSYSLVFPFEKNVLVEK